MPEENVNGIEGNKPQKRRFAGTEASPHTIGTSTPSISLQRVLEDPSTPSQYDGYERQPAKACVSKVKFFFNISAYMIRRLSHVNALSGPCEPYAWRSQTTGNNVVGSRVGCDLDRADCVTLQRQMSRPQRLCDQNNPASHLDRALSHAPPPLFTART